MSWCAQWGSSSLSHAQPYKCAQLYTKARPRMCTRAGGRWRVRSRQLPDALHSLSQQEDEAAASALATAEAKALCRRLARPTRLFYAANGAVTMLNTSSASQRKVSARMALLHGVYGLDDRPSLLKGPQWTAISCLVLSVMSGNN
eukprot:6195264-Pleurochrysis_carterae.AAC.1